ncbi:hypothetical protein SGPA1_50113 [Streptomyces misionensis JCM 4497]
MVVAMGFLYLRACGCTGGLFDYGGGRPGRGRPAVAEGRAQAGHQPDQLADLVVGPVAEPLGEQLRGPPGQFVELFQARGRQAQDARALVRRVRVPFDPAARGDVRDMPAGHRQVHGEQLCQLAHAHVSVAAEQGQHGRRAARTVRRQYPHEVPFHGADGAELTRQLFELRLLGHHTSRIRCLGQP